MIVAVEPIWERRRSQYRVNKMTHYLMWLVTSDDGNDGPALAILADGIPDPGTAFVDADGNVAYLSGLDVDPRAGSDRHFEVQAEFTTLDPSAPDDNPLNQPPGFTWSYQESTENYFQDNTPVSATPPGPYQVTNSAGEAFEQFLQRENGMLTITMTRNEATNNAAANDAYSHTINQGAVSLDGTSFGVGILKLSPIGAVKSFKTLRDGTALTYYAKTYVFKCKTAGWDDKPLDVGFNSLVGNTTTNTQSLRRIIDANGNPVTKPWPLDGSGNKKPNATDTPFVLDFKPYKTADWTALAFA